MSVFNGRMLTARAAMMIRSGEPRSGMRAAVLAAGVMAATPIEAQSADARAGRAFAAENCSRCHAIGGAGVSPNRAAPAFRVVARKYKLSDLEETFAEGIVTGHPDMPEFELTPRQIDDLLAHLRQLRGRKGSAR